MIIVYKKLKSIVLINAVSNALFLLGKQLLGLADKIEPGMTKWRGQLLFEMQSATVVLAQRALEEGKLKRFQAQVTYYHTQYLYLYQNIFKIR